MTWTRTVVQQLQVRGRQTEHNGVSSGAADGITRVMSHQDIHLRENAVENSSPRVKKPPQTANIPVPFFYAPSDDGTDENLLILLHGLGDTHIPFFKLGRQLKLPQTAVLAVRAPDQ